MNIVSNRRFHVYAFGTGKATLLLHLGKEVKEMASEKLRNIRNYLFRHGRPLDVARWNYHFEDGTVEAVLKTLASYQNSDGGFGHGLEPDNTNPDSTPIAAWVAIRILREVGWPAAATPTIRKLLAYLEKTPALVAGRWQATIPSNNLHPHAPWWSHDDKRKQNYNPSAEIAGFILLMGDQRSPLRNVAENIVNQLVADVRQGYAVEFHELSNLVFMKEDLVNAQRQDLLPDEFLAWLDAEVNRVLSERTYLSEGYGPVPTQFISDASSPYIKEHEALCRDYAAHLESTVNVDGYWPLTFDWLDETMPPAVKRDWQSAFTLENMLFLQHLHTTRLTI